MKKRQNADKTNAPAKTGALVCSVAVRFGK